MEKSISIAVNVRHLIPDKMEGIGWFTYQVMSRIAHKNPHIHFYFLFDRNFNPEFIFSDNITPIIVSPPARHPLLIYWWNEWSIPNLLNKLKPDIYVSLDGFISKRAKYKQLAVVHDVNFIVFPEYLTYNINKLYQYFFVKHIHYATRIATVSNFSKTEIEKYLRVPADKIDVVYSASNLKPREIALEEQQHIKKQYADNSDYFLYVSSIHPRKNVINLIKAFHQYKEQIKNNDKLVIVGRFFWGEKEVNQLISQSPYKKDIILTGRLPDNEIMVLMSAAKCFMLISHYEGFGVPILEAMQLKTPVITSNSTSLNEIAEDAAVKVNPNDINEIATAMVQVHNNPLLQNTLIEKGLKQSAKFNWDYCADLLWQSIQKAL